MSLTFHPLFWVYHDCWQWTETVPGYPENSVANFYHAGHVHFFFEKVNFNPSVSASGQAYGGSQRYDFRLKDLWGPNSSDPNQSGVDKLIGKPMWYFRIEEYWRRVYVQPWLIEDSRVHYPLHDGYSGIRYDASKEEHSLGPFREGGGLFFFNPKVNRTLPVEYWLDENRTSRQLYVKRDGDDTSGGFRWEYEKVLRTWMTYRRNLYGGHPGDNYYDNSGVGFNEYGDIVMHVIDGVRRFFRYEYKPYMYDALKPSGEYLKDENFWPNPEPGLSGDAFLSEYVYFYNLENLYVSFCAERELDSLLPSSYRLFISAQSGNLQSGVSGYEYLIYEDFCAVWHEITLEESFVYLHGDYPYRIKDFDGPSAFEEGVSVNPYEIYKEYFDKREIYTIPRGRIAEGDYISSGHPRELSYSDEDGARWNYPDELYFYPSIEYQRVVHLDYERLPESQERDRFVNVYTDKSGSFGDGFEMTIEIPYRRGREIQSPFSSATGVVSATGVYHHDCVKEEDKFRYKVTHYNSINDVKKYMNHKFLEFEAMRTAGVPGYADLTDKEWFDTYWKDKPIVRNEDEGSFYESEYLIDPVWMPYLTRHLIRADQIDEEGYVNSSGETIVGDGKVVVFNRPAGLKEDGMWVEQCLGAIVKAEAELVLEDPLGNRRIERVSIVAAKSRDVFNGLENHPRNDD